MTSATDSLERHRAAVRERLLRSDHVRAGPESITWKVNREMIVVAGWGRAILLQLAHPAVAAGVHGHSAFRGSLRSSLRRLQSTVGAMLSLTFGDAEQMIGAAAAINAIHDRVHGRVSPSLERPPSPRLRRTSRRAGCAGDGETYSAHDPDLQRWVHATLLESIPLTYELLVGPLTLRERDRYCSEAAIVEPLLGMPAGWLPRDSARARHLHARNARRREPRRDRHQPGARTSGALPAAMVPGLAGVPGDAAAHDRIASAFDPPGLRVRVARARRAGVRALDDAAPNVAAAASGARARVADGEAPRSLRRCSDAPVVALRPS